MWKFTVHIFHKLLIHNLQIKKLTVVGLLYFWLQLTARKRLIKVAYDWVKTWVFLSWIDCSVNCSKTTGLQRQFYCENSLLEHKNKKNLSIKPKGKMLDILLSDLVIIVSFNHAIWEPFPIMLSVFAHNHIHHTLFCRVLRQWWGCPSGWPETDPPLPKVFYRRRSCFVAGVPPVNSQTEIESRRSGQFMLRIAQWRKHYLDRWH